MARWLWADSPPPARFSSNWLVIRYTVLFVEILDFLQNLGVSILLGDIAVDESLNHVRAILRQYLGEEFRHCRGKRMHVVNRRVHIQTYTRADNKGCIALDTAPFSEVLVNLVKGQFLVEIAFELFVCHATHQGAISPVRLVAHAFEIGTVIYLPVPHVEDSTAIATQFTLASNPADFEHEGIVFGSPSDEFLVESTNLVVGA